MKSMYIIRVWVNKKHFTSTEYAEAYDLETATRYADQTADELRAQEDTEFDVTIFEQTNY